jgi:hypothetical protein
MFGLKPHAHTRNGSSSTTRSLHRMFCRSRTWWAFLLELIRFKVFILDQLPGTITSSDATPLLASQLYIPSYNVPYFPDVFNISGYGPAGFSYANDTRARIFRRDHVSVTSLESMSWLMNANDYQHDPLAMNNPCNQISARCDLGGDAFGGIDSKCVDAAGVRDMRVLAISSPSHQTEAPFSFSPHFEVQCHSHYPLTLECSARWYA